MNPDDIIRTIQDVYAWFNGFDVSPGTLLGLAALFALAGMLAIREVVAWFLKVDDLKRDIARLQEISLQLEGEVRVVQKLLQAAESRQTQEALPLASVEKAEPTHLKSLADHESEFDKDESETPPAAAANESGGPSRLFRRKEKRPRKDAFPFSN